MGTVILFVAHRGKPRHSHAGVVAPVKPRHTSKSSIKIIGPPSKSMVCFQNQTVFALFKWKSWIRHWPHMCIDCIELKSLINIYFKKYHLLRTPWLSGQFCLHGEFYWCMDCIWLFPLRPSLQIHSPLKSKLLKKSQFYMSYD